MPKTYGIGDLAKDSGVKVVTIRYYESIGLIPAPSRSAGNYRRYTNSARERLVFIRRCRDLGFTLDQVRDLLALSSEQSMPCAQVKRIAIEHRRAVAETLVALKRLDKELENLTTSCRGRCSIGDCQIIETLSAARRGPHRARRRSHGRVQVEE